MEDVIATIISMAPEVALAVLIIWFVLKRDGIWSGW